MKIKGFTLIELLILLVVVAGLSLFGMSSLIQLNSKNEEQVLIDEINSVVQYARIQAVALGHPVYLAPLDPTANWSQGIMLAHLHKKLNKEEVLNQWQWHPRYWRVTWSGVTAANKIIFSSNTINSISNGTFTLTNLRTQEKRVIILNRLGRIKLS